MVYLFLDDNSVKLLSLTKSLLGQYSVSHFSKTHSTKLLKNGVIHNMDFVSSAIQEALTSSKPNPVNDSKVFLILPQESFYFGRYTIPADMTDSAVEPFVKDKARTDLKINIDDTHFDYIISKEDGEGTVLFYGISADALEKIQDVFKLLQLDLKQVFPDTLAYYTLFAKTLRKEKKERILYTSYNKENSFSYLFDSLGLVESTRFAFTDKIKAELKKKVTELEKSGGKINRVILSGKDSGTIRQDLFTKEVGAWTNPLEKIIDNYYQEYVSLTTQDDESTHFSVVDLDACFGSFIFDQIQGSFSLYTPTRKSSRAATPFKLDDPSDTTEKTLTRSPKRFGLGKLQGIFNLRTFVIFAVSFVLSFGIIFGTSKLNSSGFNISSILPSFEDEADKPIEPLDLEAEPTEEPTPTPSISREDIKLKILNGSGIVGKASEVQDALREEGYTDIVTGNADSFDYETSVIQVKSDNEEIFKLLSSDLKNIDLLDIDKSEELDEDDAADIVLIIGTDIEPSSDSEPTTEPEAE